MSYVNCLYGRQKEMRLEYCSNFASRLMLMTQQYFAFSLEHDIPIPNTEYAQNTLIGSLYCVKLN